MIGKLVHQVKIEMLQDRYLRMVDFLLEEDGRGHFITRDQKWNGCMTVDTELIYKDLVT